MSVIVLVEAQVKPEAVSEVRTTLKEILPDTRTYDGCHGVDIYGNLEDEKTLVFCERWESRESHQRYLDWRTETGVLQRLGAALTAPLSVRYFERVDA